MPNKPPSFRAPRQGPKRASPTARGYGYKWQQARLLFLKANPLCVDCRAAGRVEAATEVDHVTPHRGDKKLMWDRKNWQPLCKACHSRKTRTRDM